MFGDKEFDNHFNRMQNQVNKTFSIARWGILLSFLFGGAITITLIVGAILAIKKYLC